MRTTGKRPTDTEAYLALLPEDQREALTRLRDQIVATAPKAVPHFGYGLPGFMYNGHPLIYFGAAKAHCALYGSVPAGLEVRLKGFDVSKGTIRFSPDKPLPASLVKAIINAKLAESAARWPAE